MTGKRPVMVATEQRFVEFFVFRLGLFAAEGLNPLPFVFAETSGFQIRQVHDFEVLLGMDVLRQCNVDISKEGRWSLSFG